MAVDEEGLIVAADLTGATIADATALPELLNQEDARVERVIADGAYDRKAVYQAICDIGARSVIPPARTAKISGEQVLADRDAHLEHIEQVGRRRWRVEVGHHQQARPENTFYRYKSNFGGRLRARNPAAQRNEVLTGCNLLNQFAAMGMPDSKRNEA